VAQERDKGHRGNDSGFHGEKKSSLGALPRNIVARELDRKVSVCLKNLDPQVPPYSDMEGVDLITEGIITMGKVAEVLENDVRFESLPRNSVGMMVDLLLNSDVIQFVVGTRIKRGPPGSEWSRWNWRLRRNIVKRVVKILEQKHLKEVHLSFI
jgi:hypothetical protein